VCPRGTDGTGQYDLGIFLTVDSSGIDGTDNAWQQAKHSDYNATNNAYL